MDLTAFDSNINSSKEIIEVILIHFQLPEKTCLYQLMMVIRVQLDQGRSYDLGMPILQAWMESSSQDPSAFEKKSSQNVIFQRVVSSFPSPS